MTWILRYRFIILLPVFFYRYAEGAKNHIFLGIKAVVYLNLFCFLSLVVLGLEIFSYIKKHDYSAMRISGYFELPWIVFSSLCVAGYSLYLFFIDFLTVFSVIAGIYFLQAVFFSIVLSRK